MQVRTLSGTPMTKRLTNDEVRNLVTNTMVLVENYIFAMVDAAKSDTPQRLKTLNAERKLLVDQLIAHLID